MRRRRGGKEDITANDVYLNNFAMVAAIVVLLLFLINPPTEESNEPPPGALSIYAAWPEGPTDVDLWVKGPEEPGAVGYSNKTGTWLSLLRDDLGVSNDQLPSNFENIYSRGTPAGEYVINVHAFHCPVLPVVVDVEVRLARPGEIPRKIFTARVTLINPKQELTVVRFRLDGKGNIVPNSLHNIYQPLYGAPRP